MSTVAPQPTEQWKAPTVAIGRWVHFFPNADPKEKPSGAYVYDQSGPPGVLELRVQRWGDQAGKQGVRHISDPVFRERPDMRRHGAWDFINDGAAGAPSSIPPEVQKSLLQHKRGITEALDATGILHQSVAGLREQVTELRNQLAEQQRTIEVLEERTRLPEVDPLSDEALRRQIVDLANQGHPPGVIAQRVRKKGLTGEKIEAFLATLAVPLP